MQKIQVIWGLDKKYMDNFIIEGVPTFATNSILEWNLYGRWVLDVCPIDKSWEAA